MKKQLTTLFLAASLVPAVALPAAAADTYAIDKSHSEISFQVRHLMSKVRGQFNEFEGTVIWDEANPAASSVSFTAQAASITTFNADRDKHLRSDDFFAVDKHPTLSFESSRVSGSGDALEVTGTLTMRGVAREVTLPVEVLGKVEDPWGNTRAGFSTSIVLDRKDFGIQFNIALDQGGFVIGDEVTVEINLELVRQKPQG